jgi:hypothetical protein
MMNWERLGRKRLWSVNEEFSCRHWRTHNHDSRFKSKARTDKLPIASQTRYRYGNPLCVKLQGCNWITALNLKMWIGPVLPLGLTLSEWRPSDFLHTCQVPAVPGKHFPIVLSVGRPTILTLQNDIRNETHSREQENVTRDQIRWMFQSRYLCIWIYFAERKVTSEKAVYYEAKSTSRLNIWSFSRNALL